VLYLFRTRRGIQLQMQAAAAAGAALVMPHTICGSCAAVWELQATSYVPAARMAGACHAHARPAPSVLSQLILIPTFQESDHVKPMLSDATPSLPWQPSRSRLAS